jgi:hypothetical protein
METILLGIMGLLTAGLATGYFLTVWFDGAKFFVEYLQLLKLTTKVKSVRNFLNAKEQGSDEDYLEYIQTWHDSFLTRLITCPKCFSVWAASAFFLYYVLVVTFLVNVKSGLVLAALSPLISAASAFTGLSLYNKLTK